MPDAATTEQRPTSQLPAQLAPRPLAPSVPRGRDDSVPCGRSDDSAPRGRSDDSVPRGRSDDSVPRGRSDDVHVELCDCPYAACHGWLGYDSSGRRIRRAEHIIRRATGGRWHHGIFYGGGGGHEVRAHFQCYLRVMYYFHRLQFMLVRIKFLMKS